MIGQYKVMCHRPGVCVVGGGGIDWERCWCGGLVTKVMSDSLQPHGL